MFITNGVGSISFARLELNSFPPKNSYSLLYPTTVIIIGIIDPSSPINNPSIINGIFIAIFDAPTNLIISISLFLENIVILIVLEINREQLEKVLERCASYFENDNGKISISDIG